jgi:hypothetical protein
VVLVAAALAGGGDEGSGTEPSSTPSDEPSGDSARWSVAPLLGLGRANVAGEGWPAVMAGVTIRGRW